MTKLALWHVRLFLRGPLVHNIVWMWCRRYGRLSRTECIRRNCPKFYESNENVKSVDENGDEGTLSPTLGRRLSPNTYLVTLNPFT